MAGAPANVNAALVLTFDRRLLQSGEVVVGWDFNWGWMVTVICVWLPSYGTLHVIGEVVSRDPGGIDKNGYGGTIRVKAITTGGSPPPLATGAAEY
jgi:hypothetical protein